MYIWKGAGRMNGLFLYSMEEKTPIEMIYFSSKGQITFRTIIVKKIEPDKIYAYCLIKHQPRIFLRVNILSVAKQRKQRLEKYA